MLRGAPILHQDICRHLRIPGGFHAQVGQWLLIKELINLGVLWSVSLPGCPRPGAFRYPAFVDGVKLNPKTSIIHIEKVSVELGWLD